jgi:hypothetical protein
MAPLDDLIDYLLIAFKERLYRTVPAVFDPAVHS